MHILSNIFLYSENKCEFNTDSRHYCYGIITTDNIVIKED